MINSELLHQLSNHPGHIVNEQGNISPSALIPFCEFGDNSFIMGIAIKAFNVPVCNSFKAKLLNNQLCYQLDLNKVNSKFSAESLKSGLTLFVDNNEERQYTWEPINQPDKGN